MTFLDLFSGIGGFRTGLEKSGHKCIGHVEIDKYARRSYEAIYGLLPCKFPDSATPNGGRLCTAKIRDSCGGIYTCKGEMYAKDIKLVTAGEVPKAEIWTFGFPCVDISLSGKMAGLRGSRSGLFFTVTGLLSGTPAQDRPEWLLVENVKHLLASEAGWAFTTVLSALSDIGYDCEWQGVNSKDFNVPQSRERVYIVGHLRGRGRRKILPVTGANTAAIKQIKYGRQGERIYDPYGGLSITLTSEAGGFAGNTGLYAVAVNRTEGLLGPLDDARTLTASDFRGINRNQGQNAALTPIPPRPECMWFIDMNNAAAMTDVARCSKAKQNAGIVHHRGETSGVFLCYGCTGAGEPQTAPVRGRRCEAHGKGRDLHICCSLCGGVEVKEATSAGKVTVYPGDGIDLGYPDSKTRRGRRGPQISQTIMASGGQGVFTCCRIRKLTPRECFRLQGFSDEQFDRAASVCSDSQLYRQAGNAVTTTVVYEIGLKLRED